MKNRKDIQISGGYSSIIESIDGNCSIKIKE